MSQVNQRRKNELQKTFFLIRVVSLKISNSPVPLSYLWPSLSLPCFLSFTVFLRTFFVADTQLCKMISLFVCPSFRHPWWSSRKVRKHAFLTLQSWLAVCEWVMGGEGMDGGCMPLPTRSQRFWSPSSLVDWFFISYQYVNSEIY